MPAEITIAWDAYGADDRAERIDCYYRMGADPWVRFDTVRPAFGSTGNCRPVKNLTLPAGFVVEFHAIPVDEDGDGEGSPSDIVAVIWPDVCEFETRGELLACMGIAPLAPDVWVQD